MSERLRVKLVNMREYECRMFNSYLMRMSDVLDNVHISKRRRYDDEVEEVGHYYLFDLSFEIRGDYVHTQDGKMRPEANGVRNDQA